jgi:hypothetical protein
MVPDNDDRWLTLENVGFTRENIRNYIRKFLDKNKQGPLIHFIESNRDLQSLAHIPLNLELICSVWSGDKATADNKAAERKNTITQLYTKMTNKFFKFIAKKEGPESKYNKVKKKILIELLGEIALAGLLINKCSIIPAKEVQAIIRKKEKASGIKGLFREALNLGIIKTISVNQDEKDNQIYFIHHTFQEYFAAMHLAQGFENYHIEDEKYKQALTMLKECKYNPYYEFMWIYTVGILYANCNEKEDYLPLFKFWDIFENEPRELLGLAHDNVKRRLINECPQLKVPSAALETLRTAVIKTTNILSNLFKIIGSESEPVAKKLYAIEEIVNLDEKTKEVENKLQTVMINDKEEGVRLYAAEALLRLGFESVHTHSLDKYKNRSITIFVNSSSHLKEYALSALYRVHGSKNISIFNRKIALRSLLAMFDECESVQVKLGVAEYLIRISENYSSKEIVEFYRKKIVKLITSNLKHESQYIRKFTQEVLSKNRDNPHVKKALEEASRISDPKLQGSIKEAMSMENISPPIDFIKLAMVKPPSNKLNGEDIVIGGILGSGAIGGITFFAGSIHEIRKAAPSKHSKFVETFANTAVTGIMTGIGVIGGGFGFGLLAIGGTITYQAYQSFFSSVSPAELDDIVLSKAENKDGEKAKLKTICEKVNQSQDVVTKWSKEGALNLKLAIQLYSYASQAVWLEPMKDITFIYKDPKAFFTVCEEIIKQTEPKQLVIRITNQRITKRTVQTKAVLGAMREAYKEAKLPIKLLDHYLCDSSLDMSTEKEKIAMARKTRSNRPVGLTLLHKAAKEGNIEEVRKLVEAKEININDFNNQDWKTPLILALEEGHWEVVEYLVENGADVNIGGVPHLALSNQRIFTSILKKSSFLNKDLLEKMLQFAADDYELQVSNIAKEQVLNRLSICIIGEDRRFIEIGKEIDIYKMQLGDIKYMERDRVGKVISNGAGTDLTLRIRLHIYLELLMNLCTQKGHDLPRIDKFNYLSREETILKLKSEIEVITQTFITATMLFYLLDKDLADTYSKEIITHLAILQPGKEYIIASGSNAPEHCMYVALYKLNEKDILVRIDNRFLAGFADSKKHGKAPYKIGGEIKSYCVGIFNLIHDRELLVEYIKKLFTHEAAEIKFPHVYGDYLPNNITLSYKEFPGEVQTLIQSWSPHTIQEFGTDNCTLSSYNLGISVRQGMEFFEWLRGKEEQLAPPLSSVNPGYKACPNNSKGPILKGGSIVTNYTHIELMKRFQKELNTDYSEILTGIVVEQCLVNLAGISTSQVGACFRQNSNASTIFYLNFKDLVEKQSFLEYYNKNFPGLIIETLDSTVSGKAPIIMNTRKLYEEVAPALGKYRAGIKTINEESKDARWL